MTSTVVLNGSEYITDSVNVIFANHFEECFDSRVNSKLKNQKVVKNASVCKCYYLHGITARTSCRFLYSKIYVGLSTTFENSRERVASSHISFVLLCDALLPTIKDIANYLKTPCTLYKYTCTECVGV